MEDVKARARRTMSEESWEGMAGNPPMAEEEMAEVRWSIENEGYDGAAANEMVPIEGGCYVEDTTFPEGYVVRSGDWMVM